MNTKPIGIFDSGVGGLTVYKAIKEVLPNESLVYIGDTARVPYGSRGKETITSFSKQLLKTILSFEVKCVVIACNTISAVALTELQSISPVPLIDVIEPTVHYAAKHVRSSVGIIGTRATIESAVYSKKIRALKESIHIKEKACPLLVPLIEESIQNKHAIQDILEQYFVDLHDIDDLILGCTHYPLLRNEIQKVIGNDVSIIDSAHPTADSLKQILSDKSMLIRNGIPSYTLLFTDFSMHVKEFLKEYFAETQSNVSEIKLIE